MNDQNATRADGSSAPACSHVPVSAEDMLMKFWNDNRITLKERTDYFRWINAENERRANNMLAVSGERQKGPTP